MIPILISLWQNYSRLFPNWEGEVLGEYKPFSTITRNALYHAVSEHGLSLSSEDADALMRSYDALHVFPEVPLALRLLDDDKYGDNNNNKSVEAYVFSNGTDEMVENSIKTSPELGPSAGRIFKALITVHSLQCFKPDKRAYEHLVRQVGKKGQESDVWVVSANPFDVVGARAAGLKAAFIDRTGKGWIDRLDEKRAPSVITSGVDEAIKRILKY